VKCDLHFEDSVWSEFSSEVIDFIKSLTSPNPTERPSAKEALIKVASLAETHKKQGSISDDPQVDTFQKSDSGTFSDAVKDSELSNE
jgi:serine/threonine protein kinase